MAARNSEQDQEGWVWQTVGVRLGQGGLDLRDQTDGSTLVKLLNARFRDEKTAQRRNGYTGVRLRDAGAYPIFYDSLDNPVSTPINPVGWVYGHGQRIDPSNVLAAQDTHIPEPGVARGVFRFGDSEVAWTGDRLLLVRDDGNPALGQDTFWSTDGTSLSYGIPAYLPVQTDEYPPDTVSSNYVEACLSADYRFVAAGLGQQVVVWTSARSNGALIDRSVLGSGLVGEGGPATAVDIRLVRSGAYVVCLWRLNAGGNLLLSFWNGFGWSNPSVVAESCNAFDIAQTADQSGFHVLWRVGSTLKVGRYSGRTTISTPYTFGTALTVTGTPNGPVAIAASPVGDLAIVWQDTVGLSGAAYHLDLSGGAQAQIVGSGTWDGGITVCYRSLTSHTRSKYPVVVHASSGSVAYVWEFQNGTIAADSFATRSDKRFNSKLHSKAFRVGNEVFCWWRSLNASTLYLVAGAGNVKVCGYADREETLARTVTDGVGALSAVAVDPLDEYGLTWSRQYNTGQDYNRAGNVRVATMNFLPELSVVQYGRSVYLAGSAPRNWDGEELGHAGWQDYPLVQNAVTMATGGNLTVGGTYRIVAYLVRYNRAGERFQSPCLISDAQTLIGSDTKITWQIQTVPSTDCTDAVIEVYRTVDGGAAFYYEGSVANDLTADVVTFTSTMSDTDLLKQPGDSHANVVPGVITQLQTYGPLGCSVFAVVGDRLWGAGGQVPSGFAQYSTLKSPKEGAGFDSLDPTQEVDTAGGEVVSIAGYSNGIVFLQRDRIYVLTDDGPDNYGNGSFSAPQLVLADGATTHAGTAVTQVGVVFWGDNGPRLLDASFRVQNISIPVHPLTTYLEPSGVQVDLSKQEVVWFTRTGTSVLWNYLANTSRWAEWTGLKVAGCSQGALAMVDGRIFTAADDVGDDGVPFEFTGATGELRPEAVLNGATDVRGVGIVGQFLGEHRLRLRVYYNGNPLWTDQWTWHPTDSSGLTIGTTLADMLPADVDAALSGRAGGYATHKRTSRGECRSFRVEWSDVGATGPTLIPYEISLELGARGGFGRTAPGTFTRS